MDRSRAVRRLAGIAALLLIALVARGARLVAIDALPTDFDEDDYLRAGQQYATGFQEGDPGVLLRDNYRTEHPPLSKLVIGLAITPLPPVAEIPDRPTTAPPASDLPAPHLEAARLANAVFGTAAAVLLGKHAFGGLGQNPFNPAMVGYAILLVAFPVEMTRWPVPLDADGAHGWTGLAQLTLLHFYGGVASSGWDGYTGATALDSIRNGLELRYTLPELLERGSIIGPLGARGFAWINLAALAGGLYLLWRRIVRWHIPVAVLAGLMVPAMFASWLDPGAHVGPLLQAGAGATMLGAFFIATDPVSAATSDRGRLWYGAGIGLVTWVIRTWGGYPDGFAFAVLLMNLAVPLIDRYTVPRIYGHPRA
jgi:electron transport complex protein RnfD